MGRRWTWKLQNGLITIALDYIFRARRQQQNSNSDVKPGQGNWNLNQLTRFCAAVDQLDFVYKLGPLTMGRPRDLQRYFNRLAQISL